MGRCLPAAKGSAYFSLLLRHRSDDFGWLELWYSQLEAAADYRICSSVCSFLLHLVSRSRAELHEDMRVVGVRGGSEEASAQEQAGSSPLEYR